MNAARTSRPGLTEEQCRRMAALVLLHRVIDDPSAFHAALLESDDAVLEPLFRHMMAEDLVEVGPDDHFRPTERGRTVYGKLLQQQQSYLAHFDIFARVDLAEGAFFDPAHDLPDDPRWDDLRVAVAEYKGIDPYQMVFLAMLADAQFMENPDWKFDLALGSNFFKEMEEIVAAQLAVADLAYTDEDGNRVPGEAVIEDVILQGAQENRRRWERHRAQQALFDEEAARAGANGGEGGEEVQYQVVYDPWGPMGAYAGSALFVEALWLTALW